MITLTAAAQQYLQEHLATGPDGTLGIRIGLRDYGCTGFGYVIDFADSKEEADHVFEFDGIQILIDGKFMPVLHGTEIDYVKQGVNSLLQYNNPNVVKSCGCGESFSFKDKL
ncbi:MAG TPA: iron-sulfur cluster assembly accessory protein [Gammaproteobacteria bacterium]|nr:iron-sulfur cluster assembly accessory protein [Gammaproteobacteria bacterium]